MGLDKNNLVPIVFELGSGSLLDIWIGWLETCPDPGPMPSLISAPRMIQFTWGPSTPFYLKINFTLNPFLPQDQLQ